MPLFVLRLLWAVRGKRRVRLHHKDMRQSLEGILVGRVGGHYVLLAAQLVHGAAGTPDTGLKGHVEVPAEKVLFIQVDP